MTYWSANDWSEVVINHLEPFYFLFLPKKKKCKKAKCLSEEALQTAEKSERQKRKGKIYPSECRVPENNKER